MITRRRAVSLLGLAPLALAAAPALAQSPGAVDPAHDMILGDVNAPVTMIEYSSLTCPHCAHFHNEILPELKERYIDKGQVRLVYRDFPFDRAALFAAVLAHCAGRDGSERFFRFVTVLFRAQGTWGRAKDPVAALKRIGRIGGLDGGAIEACFNDKALVDSIIRSRMEGAKIFGVNSTPTFIINGEKVVGAQPVANFKRVLDRLLSKS